MLNLNSRGAFVHSWQTFLKAKGFLTGVADGIYGPMTKAATEKLQTTYGTFGSGVDGVVGPQTLRLARDHGYEAPTNLYPGFPPAGTSNSVIDISHVNPKAKTMELAQAKAAGILAVFHKGTEGFTIKDELYFDHKKQAMDLGLLWAAYHFGRNEDGAKQADIFLDYVKPNGDTLLMLDFEGERTGPKSGGTMTVAQAVDFINRIKEKTGKYPGLYSGNLLRSDMALAVNETLTQCWLFTAVYRTTIEVAKGWAADGWPFWQYTDGQYGPAPNYIPTMGQIDRDLYNGSAAGLKAFWMANVV